jgi:hypothetical protein
MRTAIIPFDLIGHRAIDRSQKVDTTVKQVPTRVPTSFLVISFGSNWLTVLKQGSGFKMLLLKVLRAAKDACAGQPAHYLTGTREGGEAELGRRHR